MNPLLPELSPAVTPLGVVGVVAVFGALLGAASWTDTRRGRFVPDELSLGLVFAALAAAPLLWTNGWTHLIWALIVSAFVIMAWIIGAWADGDMKIFVAYAIILGPLALPAVVMSCFIILLYSVPTMIRTARSSEKLPRGQRLGTAPGVPGIALALPLTLWLWMGEGAVAGGLLLVGLLAFVSAEIGSRLFSPRT